jgi:hypothetical protein
MSYLANGRMNWEVSRAVILMPHETLHALRPLLLCQSEEGEACLAITTAQCIYQFLCLAPGIPSTSMLQLTLFHGV